MKSTFSGGLLLIDKPVGMSSSALDQKIKHHLAQLLGVSKRQAPKVGHSGTLDPFASGLLIVGVGNATKQLHKIEQDTKEYFATIKLGYETDTDEFTGQRYATSNFTSNNLTNIDNSTQSESNIIKQLDFNQVNKLLNNFRGHFLQIPCSVSAKHVDGQRAYKLFLGQSRNKNSITAKIDFELKPVPVTVNNLLLIRLEGDEIDIQIEASKGTYIRAIARDLGRLLGCGAHLQSLQRTKIGQQYLLDNAAKLPEILAITSLKQFEDSLLKYALGTVLTQGTFDGVHIGHAKLLHRTHELAKRSGLRSVVLLINREIDYPLTTLIKRINYIKQFGIDEVAVLNFDQIKDIEFTEFLVNLVQKYNVQTIVMTQDMHFGQGGKGTITSVDEFLKNHSANTTSLDIVPLVTHVNPQKQLEKVSSSTIRQLLVAGKVKLAKQLLNKSYKLSGRVVAGFQRGRELGFHTANIDDIATVIVGDGVYYGTITWDKQRLPAMISVGSNPTFNNTKRTVEVHIPLRNDYELYDKTVTVAFEAKLRDMVRFSSVQELIGQLQYDACLTRAAWTLDNNQLVVTPTDTVLGVFGSFNAEVADKIYQLKLRDKSKPLQVVVKDYAQASTLGEFNDLAHKLADKHWPGALTLVVPSKCPKISGGSTIGLRSPKSKYVQDLLNIHSPLYASSANISGDDTMATITQAQQLFGQQIGAYFTADLPKTATSELAEHSSQIDGSHIESDILRTTISSIGSTVVDVTSGNVKILRQGSVVVKN